MSTSTPKVKKANPRGLAVGDRVGIALPVVRQGVQVGRIIACRGTIKRLYVEDRRDRLKAEMRWDDQWKAYVYTGRDGWEFVQNLVLLEEGEDNGR
jgi:hypothetical protein